MGGTYSQKPALFWKKNVLTVIKNRTLRLAAAAGGIAFIQGLVSGLEFQQFFGLSRPDRAAVGPVKTFGAFYRHIIIQRFLNLRPDSPFFLTGLFLNFREVIHILHVGRVGV